MHGREIYHEDSFSTPCLGQLKEMPFFRIHVHVYNVLFLNHFGYSSNVKLPVALRVQVLNLVFVDLLVLHGPSMFAVKAKIYGVLYNQASSIAFDETSSYWSALKSS